MKYKIATIVIVNLAVAFLFAFTYNSERVSDEDARAAEEVKELILKAYINGAFNGLDADAMRSGFHPDFAIFSAKGEDINRYPIGVWADGVEKRKSSPEFDAAKNQWGHKFANIDVTGGSATAKIELSKDGKLVYTDYLSLLKFDSGWKIVAKVYHKH